MAWSWSMSRGRAPSTSGRAGSPGSSGSGAVGRPGTVGMVTGGRVGRVVGGNSVVGTVGMVTTGISMMVTGSSSRCEAGGGAVVVVVDGLVEAKTVVDVVADGACDGTGVVVVVGAAGCPGASEVMAPAVWAGAGLGRGGAGARGRCLHGAGHPRRRGGGGVVVGLTVLEDTDACERGDEHRGGGHAHGGGAGQRLFGSVEPLGQAAEPAPRHDGQGHEGASEGGADLAQVGVAASARLTAREVLVDLGGVAGPEGAADVGAEAVDHLAACAVDLLEVGLQEALFQAVAGAHGELGDPIGRHAQHARRLAGGDALDLGEPQHRAPPLGQGTEGGGDQRRVGRVDHLLGGARQGLGGLDAVARRDGAAGAAQHVDGGVAGGGQEVGPEAGGLGEAALGEGLHDPGEGVADRVGGVVDVAGDPIGDAHRRAGVAAVELLERLPVAGPGSNREFRVGLMLDGVASDLDPATGQVGVPFLGSAELRPTDERFDGPCSNSRSRWSAAMLGRCRGVGGLAADRSRRASAPSGRAWPWT